MMPLLNVLSAVFVRVVCVARAGVKILLSAAMGVTNVLPTFGSGGHRIYDVPPNTHTHTHTFEDLKKITYFNIYLRFTVIFTGLIRTTCSHFLPTFKYSEHVQYT